MQTGRPATLIQMVRALAKAGRWLSLVENRARVGRLVFAGCCVCFVWLVGKGKLQAEAAQFQNEAPRHEAPQGPVRVNSAGQAELDRLPGIGPALAAAILDFRAKNGPITQLEQLDEVPGIGPKKLAKLKPLVKLD